MKWFFVFVVLLCGVGVWAADPVVSNVTFALTAEDQEVGGDATFGMVRIPGGSNSGTNPLADAESYSDHYPASYSLTVSTFYMDAAEVTKGQWDTVYNWAVSHGYSFSNAGQGKGENHPVHTVNWYDCVKWCNARSEREGRSPCYTVGGSVYQSGESSPICNAGAGGYRLPTNEEWEYAARGGLSSRRFPWGDTISHNRANYRGYSSSFSYDSSSGLHPDYDSGGLPYTSPVGSFAANGHGLYDMAGNVWEWCDTPSLSDRSIWGGGWGDGAFTARCGDRSSSYPSGETDYFGFRSVCRYPTNFPIWWYTRDVLDYMAIPNDYAAANQGQVKWIATQAYNAMTTHYGQVSEGISNVVNSFSASNNYQAVNLGQLKWLAEPYYLLLSNSVPWTGTNVNDFAPANIGQVKNIFNFAIPE
jgi:sulfatase modifying factor 1